MSWRSPASLCVLLLCVSTQLFEQCCEHRALTGHSAWGALLARQFSLHLTLMGPISLHGKETSWLVNFKVSHVKRCWGILLLSDGRVIVLTPQFDLW
jgi:hypothetical protein